MKGPTPTPLLDNLRELLRREPEGAWTCLELAGHLYGLADPATTQVNAVRRLTRRLVAEGLMAYVDPVPVDGMGRPPRRLRAT